MVNGTKESNNAMHKLIKKTWIAKKETNYIWKTHKNTNSYLKSKKEPKQSKKVKNILQSSINYYTENWK